MPRLVNDAVGIFPWERQVKAEARRVDPEPTKRGGAGEVGGEIVRVIGADIEGPTGMVFAKTRSGDLLQDGREGFTGGEFFLDDLALTLDTAKPRNRHEGTAGAEGSGAEVAPGLGRARREPDFAAGGADPNADEVAALALAA